MKGIAQKLLFLSLMINLTSCSPFSPVSALPQQSYLLNPELSISQSKNNSNTKNAVLLIIQPEAPEWLNTNRMPYKIADSQISYFAQNQWVSTPSEMLKNIISRSLAQSGLYKAVVQAPFGGNVTQRLDIQLINMQQDFTQNPSVYRFELQAELINIATGNIIRTRHFSYVIPAVSNNPQGGVKAANKAVQTWIPQLIDFCRTSPANT